LSESTLSSFLLTKQEQLHQVIPVHDLHLILLQGVAQGKSESTLYAVSLPGVKALWQLDLHEALPGWPSLQLVTDGKACFTCFKEPSLPTAEGLYIYDLQTQQWAFKSDELTFVNAQGTNLLVRKKGEEEHYHVLSLANFSLSVLDNPSAWFKRTQLAKHAGKEVQYPYHIGEENPLYAALREFVQEKSSHALTGMVEYLEWADDRMLVSYYIEAANGLDQHLLITDKEGQVMLQECMDQGLKGMALDVFMVVDKQCIYIKNKTQLCVYNLV
jgi:hypothetical protein